MKTAKTAALLLALAAWPAGAETGNGVSHEPALSADGRFVVFQSEADDLVAGAADANGGYDVFLYDRVTEETVLVSRSAGPSPAAGDGVSQNPAISADGRFVVFTSRAGDLVSGQVDDGEGRPDVFLWDRVTRKTELVSHAARARTRTANGSSSSGLSPISADGRFVAFVSGATDLIQGLVDRNGNEDSDVFLYDRQTGAASLVSRSNASPRATAGRSSTTPAISADGRRVAFVSLAPDLAAGQAGEGRGVNVYLWDRPTGRIDLVSRKAGRPQVPGNGAAIDSPVLSADGSFVAFVSEARDLIPRQSGSGRNVFLWERASGKTTLVTRAASSPTAAAGGRPSIGGLSADGSWLLFDSAAPGLVPGQQDGNGRASDVFLWSRRTGTSRLVSGREGSPLRTADGGSVTYADSRARGLSADGAWAVFASVATDLVPGTVPIAGGDSFNVYLWNRSTGETTLLSHAAGSDLAMANLHALSPRISADGRWIAYVSSATDLDAGTDDTNNNLDVILQSRTGNPKIVTRQAGDL